MESQSREYQFNKTTNEAPGSANITRMGAGRTRSLITDDKQCWVCGARGDLHRHHIYFGVSNRPLSEKYGCWVYLCPYHHNMSNNSVHFNHDLDILLKKVCQRAWEKKYGDTDEFRKVFGRSYL